MKEKKKKQRDARKKSPLSDYDRTLEKIITEKRRAAKGVPQLGEQSKQSVPPLVVMNEFGSNMSVLEDYSGPKVNLGELEDFLKGANLTADQFYGNALLANATVVDEWKRTYLRGRSLYNPWALKDLGTQMRSLNSWYMEACTKSPDDDCICVRIRQEHYFRGDDLIFVPFSELHQLCHMDALDKSLMSCFCL